MEANLILSAQMEGMTTKTEYGPYINWTVFFAQERSKPYYAKLIKSVEDLYDAPDKTVYPGKGDLYRAFRTGPAEVKVVILGQDPYHGSGQANGLAFGVDRNVKVPPSLRNIFLESGQPGRTTGDLTGWADQGIMLLNTVLTVEEAKPKSHSNLGWELFTDAAIRWLCDNSRRSIVFVLWGADAVKKKGLINTRKHTIIQTSHPSPLSARRTTKNFRAFVGSGVFQEINEHLAPADKINWHL